MSVSARRQLRLPANHRSPAAARAVVREVLAEVGLTDLMDEALLLTTELATNGVVHAGTDLDVDVKADDRGVTVTVTDYRAGPIEPTTITPPDDSSEHGRGLLLVDQFASSWGTSHAEDRKGVWFRLESDTAGLRARAEARPTVEAVAASTSVADQSEEDVTATARAAERVSWLIHIGDELRMRLTLPQLISEMLMRLCEVVGASGGTVWLDEADGSGAVAFARHGSTEPGDRTVTVALPVHRPYSGRVELYPEKEAPPHWTSLAALSADRMALAFETDRVASDDRRRRGWLTFLAEAGELMAQSLDVDLTVALVPQIMVPRLGEWCAVHLIDEYGQPRQAALVHTDERQLSRLRHLLDDPEVVTRLREVDGVTGAVPLPPPAEGVVVPLAARGQVLGALAVGRPEDRSHTPDDMTILEDAARRAALAIDNARIHTERKDIAQAFQNSLLPSALPEVPGISFAAEYVPASTGTDVGGDFYDVLTVADGHFMSIGDVCGKGAQAAAVTGLVRDVLRVMMRDGRPLPRALELLNHTLLEQPEEGRYATLATAQLRRAGDNLKVRLVLSGHERPLLLHRDGRCEYVGALGTAVGLLPTLAVNPVECVLEPGDNLVFYTDGVTERRDGTKLFGHSSICRSLRPLAGYPAKVVAARLRQAVLEFSEETPRDDMAVLVVSNEPA
ncbi:MAG TPA: SpoIIE family protein phosphatase [Stackebrandtia sp.]|nr:SpoIIE family protein phosphatase [Stackebrandtia sp.]HZE42082.1 SpoIIE family protein phosphatase [Stackebrandtia sp.]